MVIVSQAEGWLAPSARARGPRARSSGSRRCSRSPRPWTTLVLSWRRRSTSAPAHIRLLGKHATLVDCESPADVAGAARWVNARVGAAGVDIDPAGARALATLAGFPDRPRAPAEDGECKAAARRSRSAAALRTRPEDRFTLDDVREVAGPAALQDDWAMANAIEAGQGGEALRQLALILDTGARLNRFSASSDGWCARSFHRWPRGSFPVPLNRSFGRTSTSSGRAAIRACCWNGWSSSYARESERGPDSVRGVGDDNARPDLRRWLRRGDSAATCSGRRRSGG